MKWIKPNKLFEIVEKAILEQTKFKIIIKKD